MANGLIPCPCLDELDGTNEVSAVNHTSLLDTDTNNLDATKYGIDSPFQSPLPITNTYIPEYPNYTEYVINEVMGIRDLGASDSKVNKQREGIIAYAIVKAMLKSNFRYGEGGIMAYTGKKYILLSKEEMETLISTVMMAHNVGIVYVVNSPGTILKHIDRQLAYKKYKPVRSIVSFENGVLNLDTGVFERHSEKCETTTYMQYNYEPKARCDRWRSFLTEVIGDQETINTLQEFCGAVFVDRKRFKIESMLYLLGEGSNGKGVFLEVLMSLFNPENITPFSLQALCTKGNSEYNIAAINNKLLNISTDLSKTDFSGGEYKALVSGEPLSARNPYGKPYSATNIPLLVAAVNKYPDTTDHSHGHFRRNLIVPFDKIIPEAQKDTQLANKLKGSPDYQGELSGIFNWVREGMVRFIENQGKFKTSERIKIENEKVRISSNSILSFLDDNGYYPDGSKLINPTSQLRSIEDIYKEFIKWCADNGNNGKWKSNNLGAKLSSEKFSKVRIANKYHYYIWTGERTYTDDMTPDEIAKSKEINEEQKKQRELENQLPF